MSVARQQFSWSLATLQALAGRGVGHVIIAPGSRHTPLVLAAHHLAREGHLDVHDVLDERVAGFVALGLARVTGAPAAILTTSGTAGAHLYPAVIEAERSRIPMVIFTADRPASLQGVGAPQTIAQAGLFGVHTRANFEAEPLAKPGSGPSPGAWVAQVLGSAVGIEPGPVHVNVPFSKPLWEPGADEALSLAERPDERTPAPALSMDEAALDALARRIDGSERGVIFMGPGDPGVAEGTYGARRDALAQAALALADKLGWPLISDGGSATSLSGGDGRLITTFESLVRSGRFEDVGPDLILRLGQVATSTAVGAWLASRSAPSIQLDPSGRIQDPDRVCEPPIGAHPARTLRAIAERIDRREPGTWDELWRSAEAQARRVLEGACAGSEPWSGAVTRAIVESCPEGALIHVASSMPIRDLDAFGGAPTRRIHVASNRGANGIDGLISTALGEALAWPGPVVAMVGDLALAHDLGGLAAARQALAGSRAASLTVVVLDNGGGAIFDELPIAAHPTAHETHFIAAQKVQASAVSRALDVETRESSGRRTEVREALADLMERPGLSLLHVRLDRREDGALRRRAHDLVRSALGDAPEAGAEREGGS
jgi:2-succinyl-5-enolpyruvyl-6-hydroxy-3-cyclohexene-1-carboxylate synthase